MDFNLTIYCENCGGDCDQKEEMYCKDCYDALEKENTDLQNQVADLEYENKDFEKVIAALQKELEEK